MKTNRRLRVAFALTVALGICSPLCLPPGADAGQITFGPSSENVTFTGDGAGSVLISISDLTGPAFYTGNALVGAFAFGPVSFTAGPGPSIYPASPGAESFQFTGSDNMTGTISWSFIQDGTPQPKFFGSLLVATASGSPAFLADFAPEQTISVDLITNVMAGASSLDFLGGTTGSATATISSGQVMADVAAAPSVPVPVPEPASILLIGIAVVGLGVGLGRRLGRRA
jgi:hypothetical protein